MVFCEGDAAAGVYAMDGAITRAGVNARAIKLQAVAIIAGSAIKLPTENAGEGLLRDIGECNRQASDASPCGTFVASTTLNSLIFLRLHQC